jgi:hypothetical protein
MMGQRKPDGDARRRAMVRLNGMMFYCVGIASFLESTAPLDTNRLIRLAEARSDDRLWLERVWLPRRAAHGRLFREYIEATWPEFDWDSAYQEFAGVYASRAAARVGPPGVALEYVARCTTETTLAVFYRTLARSADDPLLRELADAAARDHVAYFSHFRAWFERASGCRRAGLATAWRAVLASCRSAREVDVAAAFHPLGRNWHGGWVFPELTYQEFLAKLSQWLRRHARLGPVEHLMFRVWLRPPRDAEAPGPGIAPPSGRRSRDSVSAARAA